MATPQHRNKKRKRKPSVSNSQLSSQNSMMVIHHSKFVPKRSYDKAKISLKNKPDIIGRRLYYSYGYTSEYHITEPLISAESISNSEFSDFLQNISNQNKTLSYKTQKLKTYKSHKKKHGKRPKKVIIYNGITHDPTLQCNAEVRAIDRHHSVVERYGLTVPLFTHSLSLQPQILHLTFHGEYDCNTHRSIVRFDGTPTLAQLLCNNDTFLKNNRSVKYFRDYFAAIAILFEEEILTFLSQPCHATSKRPMCAKYTFINTDLLFEKNAKLRQLLENIVLKRFHCCMTHYRNKKFMAIWYGKWSEKVIKLKNGKTRKELVYEREPNHRLLPSYYLSHLCRNRQIDGICRQIKTRYKKICAKNPNLLRSLNRKYQQFCWTILNIAICAIVPKQVWQWLSALDMQHSSAVSDFNDTDLIEPSVVNGELYNHFRRTFELRVCPTQNNAKIATKKSEKIMEQRIKRIVLDILKDMREDVIISEGREFESEWLKPPLMNYKILRFKNDCAIYNAKVRVINKYKRRYHGKYDILWNNLYSATTESQLLCGYIPLNEQKPFVINRRPNNKIRRIIHRCLKSKAECNISLLLLLGCHSYHLAQIFVPFIECIVCVHPLSQIDDDTCVKFSEYFYRNLSVINSANHTAQIKLKYIVIRAFEDAIAQLSKSCKYSDNECALHSHISDTNTCMYHPNDEFLRVSANKQNLTRKDHLRTLRKYTQHFTNEYGKTYTYEHPLQRHYSYPSILIQRCDYQCYEKLKKYVYAFNPKHTKANANANANANNNNYFNFSQSQFKKVRKPKPKINNFNFESNTQKQNINIFGPRPPSPIPKYLHTRMSPSHSRSIGYDGTTTHSNNNSINILDIFGIQSPNALALEVSTVNNSTNDSAECKISEECIIEWEWYESKISSKDFSYSIIKCESEVSKNNLLQILRVQKERESADINAYLKREKTLSGIECNMSWDVCDVPICCCSIDAPHRVEDKLVLLIDGTQIKGRDIQLCALDSDHGTSAQNCVQKKAKSMPNLIGNSSDSIYAKPCGTNEESESVFEKVIASAININTRCNHNIETAENDEIALTDSILDFKMSELTKNDSDDQMCVDCLPSTAPIDVQFSQTVMLEEYYSD